MLLQSSSQLPTRFGNFTIYSFSDDPKDEMPHVALTSEQFNPNESVLVRIHSACMTGDVFHSLRCDCGDQLAKAMEWIAKDNGMLIYMRQEGRGIGLIEKIKAYELQDQGYNTVQANEKLGYKADERTYADAISILKYFSILAVRLISNNPLKMKEITNSGIELVERVPLIMPVYRENKKYLDDKKELMGHLL